MAIQYTDDYLEFYGEYPRHEGKADGQKAWNKLTDTDRRAALADVRKRVRLGAYSSNKKLIQLPASYLNAGRWEDDWQDTLESSRKGEDEKPNSGGVQYNPIDDGIEMTKWQSLANRWCLRWFYVYGLRNGGLSTADLQAMVGIKNAVVTEMSYALDEDLAAAANDRDAQIECIWTFLNVLIDRLDLKFNCEYKPLLLKS